MKPSLEMRLRSKPKNGGQERTKRQDCRFARRNEVTSPEGRRTRMCGVNRTTGTRIFSPPARWREDKLLAPMAPRCGSSTGPNCAGGDAPLYSIFQKSMPDACLPTSMDARVSNVRRSITSTVPGSSATPSTVTNAKRLSGLTVTP